MLNRQLLATGLGILALGWAGASCADWQLQDEQSSVHFVSTKAGHVAEVHHFERLMGSVDEKGQAKLRIDLASVNTAIDIRDQRMQEHLFETDRFSHATFGARVPIGQLAELDPGEQMALTLEVTVGLHGQQVDLKAPVEVVKLADDRLKVYSRHPVVINAEDFGLVAGIEKLREIAGLSAISHSVPVSFQLSFEAD